MNSSRSTKPSQRELRWKNYRRACLPVRSKVRFELDSSTKIRPGTLLVSLQTGRNVPTVCSRGQPGPETRSPSGAAPGERARRGARDLRVSWAQYKRSRRCRSMKCNRSITCFRSIRYFRNIKSCRSINENCLN